MSKRMFSLVSMFVVVSFLLVSLVAVSCAQPVAPPAEEAYQPEKITFYATGDYSGPMGPINAAHIPFYSDWCEYMNEQGGIRGVPVDFVARDNGGDLAAGIAAYDYFRSLEPKPIIGSFHPAFVVEALRERLREDHIVDFHNTPSNTAVFPVDFSIASAPSYIGSLAITMEYVLKNWKGGDIKLGLLTWDNAFGKAIFDDQFRKWVAETDGIEIVAEEVFSPAASDVATQITTFKSKGVNWVADNTLGAGPVVISKSIDALGLLAKDLDDVTPGKMHRCLNIWGMDESCVRLGGGPGGILDGAIGVRPGASWSETENPGVKLIKEIADKHNRGPELRTVSYITKWGKWNFVAAKVGEIVDEYGWGGLTGDRMIDAMLNTQHFDVLGVATFTYYPTCPYMLSGKVYQIQDGAILPVTDDWNMPDLRPEEYKLPLE